MPQASGMTVVAVNPGWARTDMGGPTAPLSADEAARDVRQFVENNIYAGLNGAFVNSNGSALPW
jgi:NAD(P)-dependent dehydrogenase (short-subunit alcohol dehydrogenase family)